MNPHVEASEMATLGMSNSYLYFMRRSLDECYYEITDEH